MENTSAMIIENLSAANGKLADQLKRIRSELKDCRNELCCRCGQYRHAHDELTVLATGNNRFYEMSDNYLFSDTLRALNKRNQWYEDLKKDPYNYYTSAQPDANGEYQSYGSYTLD